MVLHGEGGSGRLAVLTPAAASRARLGGMAGGADAEVSVLRMILSDVEMVSADVALREIAKGLGGEAPPCSIRDAYIYIYSIHIYIHIYIYISLRCGALRKALAVSTLLYSRRLYLYIYIYIYLYLYLYAYICIHI